MLVGRLPRPTLALSPEAAESLSRTPGQSPERGKNPGYSRFRFLSRTQAFRCKELPRNLPSQGFYPNF